MIAQVTGDCRCDGAEVITPVRMHTDHQLISVGPGRTITIHPTAQVTHQWWTVTVSTADGRARLHINRGCHHNTARGGHVDLYESLRRHIDNQPKATPMPQPDPFPHELTVEVDAEDVEIINAWSWAHHTNPLRRLMNKLRQALPEELRA